MPSLSPASKRSPLETVSVDFFVLQQASDAVRQLQFPARRRCGVFSSTSKILGGKM